METIEDKYINHPLLVAFGITEAVKKLDELLRARVKRNEGEL